MFLNTRHGLGFDWLGNPNSKLQVFNLRLALFGSNWLWLALAGSGWLYVPLAGSGCLWLARPNLKGASSHCLALAGPAWFWLVLLEP